MTLPNTIPTASLGDLFPGVDGMHPLVVSGYLFRFRPEQMPALLPHEQLVMAALVRHLRPRRVLEFGTAAGQTTYALAANAPSDAEIFTVDLLPEAQNDYTRQCMLGRSELGACFAQPFSGGGRIVQALRRAGAPLPPEIQAMAGRFDLIHVDGDHGYAGVR
ncbi:MAG: class I SAM-dependent methyltransferase, partial [Magnetococcales bacterium]|nr:class I SAM-dependent methyltransferase [Magnetococcales bacterium]